MSDERIFDPELGEEETKKEVLLRPKDFTEYIGQKKIVQNKLEIKSIYL